MNTTPCTKLHLFIDGELPEGEAEAFRQHLPRCAECEVELRDLLQLEMLAARALGTAEAEEAPAKVVPLWPRLSRTVRAAVPVALAAGLAAVGVFHFQAEPHMPPGVYLADADARMMEARLSHPEADRWKEFGPMRGTVQSPEPLPLRPLAQLEERKDYRGIAAAYALRGDWQQAEAFLARAPDSADTLNDRAAVALSKQNHEEALELLRGALRQNPRHAQALWNRGLALREAELPRRAEESFRQVAAMHEQGWSAEALERAEELRAKVMEDEERWSQQVREARRKLAAGVDAETVRQLMQPPHKVAARMALYEAVRTATTPGAVTALLPLAEALDRDGGGTVLRDYVKATAARDFGKRASLAREYSKLLDGQASPGLLDVLRHSEEQDLYFGALLLTGAAVKDAEALNALHRFAHASSDPWPRLMLGREQARVQDAAGNVETAEKALLAALRTCKAYKGQFRCADIH